MLELKTYIQLFILSALLVLSGCASGPKIETLQAPDADYSRYQTFSFVDPLGTDRAGYASIVSQQLMFSTRRELELRNFEFVENAEDADLLINFNAHLNEQIRTREVIDPMIGPSFWDYRFGMYTTWPSYQRSTEIEQYTEGTVVIDLIDADAERMIWEGSARGRVTERTRRDVAAELDKAVTSVFERFPIPSSSR